MSKKSNNLCWKEENAKYLEAMQKFLDRAENISDEILKKDIISAMLNCDSILTKLAQDEIKNAKNKCD